MKRKLALFLATIACTTVLVGCGGKNTSDTAEKVDTAKINTTGYPIVDEKITLTAVGYGDPGSANWGEYQIFKDITEQTNVEVKWDTISGDGATEKLNLILSSKELPDMIFSGISSANISKNASNGILIPLEDLIENYAPNIKKILDENPKIRKAITMPDGHIYSIPAINNEQEPVHTTTLNINKTWLDTLGLNVPTTTEELANVLKAFKEQDPNRNSQQDEIPLTFMPTPPYEVWNGDAGFSGAFGVVNSSLMVKDGKFAFTPAEEGYKEYINYLTGLYKDGLLDKELFTQDFNQYMAKVTTNAGVYLTNGPVKATDEYIAITPLKGPNGDQLWSGVDFSIDKNRGVITSACQNPEIAIRYMDSFFEPLNSLRLQHGIYLEESEDGKFKVLPTEPGKPGEAPGSYVAKNLSREITDQYLIKTEQDVLNDERREMYKPFLSEAVPLLTLTAEESKELSQLSTDISNFVNEKKAKWVSGQADVNAEWDQYLKELKGIGLDRYMELYNGALERFNSN